MGSWGLDRDDCRRMDDDKDGVLEKTLRCDAMISVTLSALFSLSVKRRRAMRAKAWQSFDRGLEAKRLNASISIGSKDTTMADGEEEEESSAEGE